MSEAILISADQHWILWAVLLSAAAFGVIAEKTKWGSKLSAVVLSILTAFVLSNLSIIPTAAPAYDVVWSYLVPLAIPLLLFKADLKRKQQAQKRIYGLLEEDSFSKDEFLTKLRETDDNIIFKP